MVYGGLGHFPLPPKIYSASNLSAQNISNTSCLLQCVAKVGMDKYMEEFC